MITSLCHLRGAADETHPFFDQWSKLLNSCLLHRIVGGERLYAGE
jgi:hypothetical protein